MATTKELKTRIALKYDSYSAWTTAPGKDLVLLPGELGICYIDAADQGSQVVPTVLFKVGDGTSTFAQLPWASAKAADVYSWAKASNVAVDGKNIKFVGGAVDAEGNKIDKVITLNFATPEEVETITNSLDSRIEALESKFTGESSVQGQIDALDGRLDVIEGSGDGSVAKALVDAKAYTNEREVEIKKYVDQAEADANNYTDGKVTTINSSLEAIDGRLDVIESTDETKAGSIAKALKDAKDYADQSEADAVTTANAYADQKDAALKTELQSYANQAEADAKSYSDGKLATAVGTLEAKDTAQDTEIANKLDKTTYEAYIAGKAMSDAELKSYADGVADTAKSDAIAAAKTETQNQINTLVTSGQVKTNTDAIAQNKADIEALDNAYQKAVSDEAKAREDADKALSDRIDSIDTFFATAEGETLDTALDTLKEIQDYLNGEGNATSGMLGRLAQAEKDIDDLQEEFADGGRVTVAEKDIDDLQAVIETKLTATEFTTWKGTHETDHAKTATEITTEITDAVNGEKSAREAADTAINEKIGGSYTKDATVAMAIQAAQDQADKGVSDAEAAVGRLDLVEPKVATLQDIVDGYTDKGSIKTAIEAATNAASVADGKAATAQSEVDALEGVVSTLRNEYDVTKELATTNEAAIESLTSRMDTAESDIDALQAIVSSGENTNAKLREDITALQALTNEDGEIRSEIAAAKKAGDDAAQAVADLTTGQVATNKASIEGLDGRVTAIESDYLKAADLYIFNCGSATTVTHEQPKA